MFPQNTNLALTKNGARASPKERAQLQLRLQQLIHASCDVSLRLQMNPRVLCKQPSKRRALFFWFLPIVLRQEPGTSMAGKAPLIGSQSNSKARDMTVACGPPKWWRLYERDTRNLKRRACWGWSFQRTLSLATSFNSLEF